MQRQSYSTYLVDEVKFPFCKGCGHTHAVRYLDKALTILQRDPCFINLVSDIGCIELVDSLFPDIHTVHTTHGRSTAFATGIELADSILHDSDLKTVVILGDGGATIGLLHIVNAALMNVDISVLVCNNFLYGMTGGQHSALTPMNMVTTTTPVGNIIPPMDICKVVESCEAGFVARALATDRNLPDILAKAIDYSGFSLVEILEICPEYGDKSGEVDDRRIKEFVKEKDFPLGILVNRSDRLEFGEAYGKMMEKIGAEKTTKKDDGFLESEFSSTLDKQIEVVIAGTAGERVQRAAYLLLQTAIKSGLHATQKNDNPATGGSGFSLSEVVLSPNEIYFTEIECPDCIIISSQDGFKEIRANGTLGRVGPDSLIIADESIRLTEAEAGCRVIYLPLRTEFGPESAALGGIMTWLKITEILSSGAVAEVIEGKIANK